LEAFLFLSNILETEKVQTKKEKFFVNKTQLMECYSKKQILIIFFFLKLNLFFLLDSFLKDLIEKWFPDKKAKLSKLIDFIKR
jgi:hypothetical protein